MTMTRILSSPWLFLLVLQAIDISLLATGEVVWYSNVKDENNNNNNENNYMSDTSTDIGESISSSFIIDKLNRQEMDAINYNDDKEEVEEEEENSYEDLLNEHSDEEIQEEEELQQLRQKKRKLIAVGRARSLQKRYYYHSDRQQQSRIEKEEEVSEFPSIVPAPPASIPSLASQTPSISISPTFQSKCYVCSSSNDDEDSVDLSSYNQTVQYPYIEFPFFDEQLQCSSTEIAGLLGFVPPKLCPILQLAVRANCKCINGTSPAIANGNMNITAVGTGNLFDKNNTIPDVPTYSPATTIMPTTTQHPTVLEPCYICGNANRYVANPRAKLVVFEQETNCQRLELYGREKGMDSKTCSIVAQQAYTTCRCSDTASPTPLITMPPSMTHTPTMSEGPTYDSRCNLCTDDRIYANPTTTSDPALLNETLAVRGVLYACTSLQKTAIDGFVSPSACQEIIVLNKKVLKAKRKNNSTSTASKDGSPFEETGCTCMAPQQPNTTTGSNSSNSGHRILSLFSIVALTVVGIILTTSTLSLLQL